MPRSKPYTGGLAFFDFLMLLCTCGLWLIIMLLRELHRWGS
jgi:hypothetical protein